MISKWLYIHIPKTGGTWFKNAMGIGNHEPGNDGIIRHKDEDWIRNPETSDVVYMENLAHAFPYKFTVDGWDPKSSKYSHMSFLKDKPYHRVYNPDYSEEHNHMEYITIVRNPFSLFYSYWRYRPTDQSDWTANTPKLGGWANCNVIMDIHSFHDFVDHYLDDGKVWHVPPLKENLFAQIYRKDGTLIPKKENVLRCEHLKAETRQWCLRNNVGLTGAGYREVPTLMSNINPIKEDYADKYTPLQIYKLEERWAEILETFGYHIGGIRGEL